MRGSSCPNRPARRTCGCGRPVRWTPEGHRVRWDRSRCGRRDTKTKHPSLLGPAATGIGGTPRRGAAGRTAGCAQQGGEGRTVADGCSAGVVVGVGVEGLVLVVPRGDASRPLLEHRLVIGPDLLAPARVQPQVAPVGRAPQRRQWQGVAVGPAQGGAATFEQPAYVVDPPGRVPWLHRDPAARRERGKGAVQPLELEPQVRRQLQQHRAELVTEAGHAVHQPGDGFLRVLEPLEVGEEAGCLDGQDVVGRRPGGPGLEALPRRQPVEGVVDLDGLPLRGVVLQPQPLRQVLGVEAAAPVVVLPAGGADEHGHAAAGLSGTGSGPVKSPGGRGHSRPG